MVHCGRIDSKRTTGYKVFRQHFLQDCQEIPRFLSSCYFSLVSLIRLLGSGEALLAFVLPQSGKRRKLLLSPDKTKIVKEKSKQCSPRVAYIRFSKEMTRTAAK